MDTANAEMVALVNELKPVHAEFHKDIAEIKTLAANGQKDEEEAGFYHFRDTGRNEIDLVIERSDGKVVGVEVKASMSVKPEDLSGLSVFAGYAGDKFLHGVYSGDKILPFRKDTVFHALPISSLYGP